MSARRLAKAARLGPRLAWAAAAGAVWRLLRKLSGRPPRIWHGMFPLHSMREMVRADRLVGYPSRSVVRNARLGGYALVAADEFDRVVESEGVPWDEWNWVCLEDLLVRGDIWVAFFECLFLPAEWRRTNVLLLRVLRALGVRIIVLPHGGDLHHRSRFRDRYDVLARQQRDYPEWDLTAFAGTARARIAAFCAGADFVVASNPELRRYLPRCDALFNPFVVDCAALRPPDGSATRAEDAKDPRALDPVPHVAARRPLVVHAPNHRAVKGTDALLAVTDRLRERGIAFDLHLIERVPRAEAMLLYAKADVIADQFCAGGFGIFALEGLALGKPVLTYLDQEHLGDPVFNLPLVNANPDNLEGVLAVLLQVPELRARLGCAGRESVTRYQSVEALAPVWDMIYRHVWRGAVLDLEALPLFDPARSGRSFSEDPACEAFWPVPVTDLLPRIRAAVRWSSGA